MKEIGNGRCKSEEKNKIQEKHSYAPKRNVRFSCDVLSTVMSANLCTARVAIDNSNRHMRSLGRNGKGKAMQCNIIYSAVPYFLNHFVAMLVSILMYRLHMFHIPNFSHAVMWCNHQNWTSAIAFQRLLHSCFCAQFLVHFKFSP